MAVLRVGGNAFDAAVAAGFAAAVCEPCLTSLAGGGFLLAHTAAGETVLCDFFVTAPGLGAARAARPGDLAPVALRFDRAEQVFHVGPAAVATPGVLAGYLHVHRRLGRLPLADVVAPAARLARAGVPVDPFFARLVEILAPIVSRSDEGRALFTRNGRPLRPGDTFTVPALGALLDAVGAGRITGFGAAQLGGQVTADDVAAYRVVEREPLAVRYRDATVLTNPPPSFGGTLVAHALAELAATAPPTAADDARHLCALAAALVGLAGRRASLGAGTSRGTTHLSVADAEGNVAAMTTSNGSGSGVFVPGTGVQLNNMMGEEDLHPAGLGTLPPGTPIGSMMAPTIVLRPGRGPVAFGSGGSERIRSAITQLVVQLLDHRRSLADAVVAPRLHWDGRVLQAEPGLPPSCLAALRQRWPVNEWRRPDLYFGGVHAVALPAEAVGDPRRGGLGVVVSD